MSTFEFELPFSLCTWVYQICRCRREQK